MDKTFILPGQNWVTRQLGQGQMDVRLSALPVAIRLGGAQATSVYIFIKYVYVYVYVAEYPQRQGPRFSQAGFPKGK